MYIKIQNQNPPTPRKISLTIDTLYKSAVVKRNSCVSQLLTVSCFLFHRATSLLSYQGSCSCRAAGESPPRSRTKGHRPWGRHRTAAARRRRPTQNTLSILFFCGNHESSPPPTRRRISSVDWRHRLLHSRARGAAHYVAYIAGASHIHTGCPVMTADNFTRLYYRSKQTIFIMLCIFSSSLIFCLSVSVYYI